MLVCGRYLCVGVWQAFVCWCVCVYMCRYLCVGVCDLCVGVCDLCVGVCVRVQRAAALHLQVCVCVYACLCAPSYYREQMPALRPGFKTQGLRARA